MKKLTLESRSLKFRAWTGNEMVVVQTLCFNNGGTIWYGHPPHMGWSCTWPSDQWNKDNPRPDEGDLKPVMQWSGLHDKNGVEIFEGDIVLIDNWYYPQALVVVEDSAFGLRGVGGFFVVSEQKFLSSQLKVIGNLFQNPDLLNT